MRDTGRNVMKAVKINKEELLGIVRANKEKHVAEYNEAIEDYKLAALKVANANMELVLTGNVENIQKCTNMLSSPTSYENSYTRAIRMLELSVDDTIEVQEDVFNQLVLDEWSWKNSFSLSGSLYKSML